MAHLRLSHPSFILTRVTHYLQRSSQFIGGSKEGSSIGKGWVTIAGHIPLLSWHGWHPTYRDPRNSLADLGRGPVLGRDGSISLVTSPFILTRVTPYLPRSSQFIGGSREGSSVGKGWVNIACHIPFNLDKGDTLPTAILKIHWRIAGLGRDGAPLNKACPYLLSQMKPYLPRSLDTDDTLPIAILKIHWWLGRWKGGEGWLTNACHNPPLSWHPTNHDYQNSFADLGSEQGGGEKDHQCLSHPFFILTRVTPYLLRSSQFIGESRVVAGWGAFSKSLPYLDTGDTPTYRDPRNSLLNQGWLQGGGAFGASLPYLETDDTPTYRDPGDSLAGRGRRGGRVDHQSLGTSLLYLETDDNLPTAILAIHLRVERGGGRDGWINIRKEWSQH